MATVALSTNQKGKGKIAGIDYFAIMTITPGTTATAGENLDLTAHFSTVDAIVYCGASNATIAKYVPAFSFTPGAATSATSVKFFCLVQDGAAGVMEPDNGSNLVAVGTFQVMIYGKRA
jgi:hypothetical protein